MVHIIAQLGTPDMKLPIQLALTYPDRRYLPGKRLDFAELGSISFFAPDFENFPGLTLAYKVGKEGGNRPQYTTQLMSLLSAVFLITNCHIRALLRQLKPLLIMLALFKIRMVDNILETEAAVYEFLQSALA